MPENLPAHKAIESIADNLLSHWSMIDDHDPDLDVLKKLATTVTDQIAEQDFQNLRVLADREAIIAEMKVDAQTAQLVKCSHSKLRRLWKWTEGLRQLSNKLLEICATRSDKDVDYGPESVPGLLRGQWSQLSDHLRSYRGASHKYASTLHD